MALNCEQHCGKTNSKIHTMESDSEADQPILASSDRIASLWEAKSAKLAALSSKVHLTTTTSSTSQANNSNSSSNSTQTRPTEPAPTTTKGAKRQRPGETKEGKEDGKVKRRRQYEEEEDRFTGAGIGYGEEGLGREEAGVKKLMERLGVKRDTRGNRYAAQGKGKVTKKKEESSSDEEDEGRSGLGRRKRGK
jgi:hypothetical protein